MTTVVFDAYGTLFDVTAAARRVAQEPGQDALAACWQALARDWRDKQLQYTWHRAVTGDHADFARVTADALDWALAAAGLSDTAMPEAVLSGAGSSENGRAETGQAETGPSEAGRSEAGRSEAGLRNRLLALYDRLDAYPEVSDTLRRLRASGHATAILSNGTPAMLAAATSSAGIADLLDAVLSVEDVGVFKPAARVYDMVGARFGTAPADVLFVSANGWDAAAAGAYGFRTAWVNRAGAPVDRLPDAPDHNLADLAAVPDLAA